MSALTRLSIARPLLVLTIIIIFTLFGVQSYLGLNVEDLPRTNLPYATILVAYPGATPREVADNVLKPIEDALSNVTGIRLIQATTQDNFGSILVRFQDGVDINQAVIDVDREITLIRDTLPDGIEEPEIEKLNVNAAPVLYIAFSGLQSTDALYDLVDQSVVPRLRTVQGVGSINITGGREQQVNITVDPTRLAAYGLPLLAVNQALQQENIGLTAGSIDQQDSSQALRASGRFKSLTDIENLVIGSVPGQLQQVYLRDVATVDFGYDDVERRVTLNGEAALMMTVVKADDGNAVAMANAVKAELAVMEQELPDGVAVNIVQDLSNFTRSSILSVQEDLVLAIVITGAILLLFLHTVNSAAVVIVTVPTALIITFLGMQAFGFTLNVLTLLALTVSIGSVVDDAIVIVENVIYHLKQGKVLKQAAFDATSELGFTILGTTLVAMVVYIPVALMEGVVGQFFYQYGLTIAIAFGVSVVLAFTLNPILASWWLPDPNQDSGPRRGLARLLYPIAQPFVWVWFNVVIRIFEGFFTWLANGYRRLLKLALANFFTQLTVVVICLAALTGGGWLLGSGLVPNEFQPYIDNDLIRITLEMPPGSSLDVTERAARQVEQIILEHVPEASSILTDVGGELSTSTNASKNFANLTVVFPDKRLRERGTLEIINLLRPKFKDIPGARVNYVIDGQLMDLVVYGPDPETAVATAEEVKAILATVPGAGDVRTPGVGRTLQDEIVTNRVRAQEVGVSTEQIVGTLRTTVNGQDIGEFTLPGTAREIDIQLRATEAARADLRQILQLPINYINGEPVRIGQVAEVESKIVASRVQRINRQFATIIFITPVGRGFNDVLADIRTRLDAHEFALGTGYELGDESETTTEGGTQMIVTLGISILLIYLLMVGMYESLLIPISVMSGLPMALPGVIGGLYLTGQTFNFVTVLGLVMLSGLIARNAILLVDQANTYRDEGKPVKIALVDAGHRRLKPIMMTALSLVFALIPLLLNQGPGSELRTPIAASVIGGTLTSAAFFLFLVPVVYNFLDNVGRWLSWVSHNVLGITSTSAESQPLEATSPDQSNNSTNRPKRKKGLRRLGQIVSTRYRRGRTASSWTLRNDNKDEKSRASR